MSDVIGDSKILGENVTTASHRLKRRIFYYLASQLNMLNCFRCGQHIEEESELSIDHKIPWRKTKSIELFWDLDNIALSHKKCNYAAGSREHQTSKTECPRGHAYTEENTYRGSNGHRQCNICRLACMREAARIRRLNNNIKPRKIGPNKQKRITWTT